MLKFVKKKTNPVIVFKCEYLQWKWRKRKSKKHSVHNEQCVYMNVHNSSDMTFLLNDHPIYKEKLKTKKIQLTLKAD